MPYFRFPFLYNSNLHTPNYYNNIKKTSSATNNTENINNKNVLLDYTNKKNNSKKQNDNYFFELFGLKLYSDDILLMSLIFFLYQEGIKDDELFLSLILLLLT